MFFDTSSLQSAEYLVIHGVDAENSWVTLVLLLPSADLCHGNEGRGEIAIHRDRKENL